MTIFNYLGCNFKCPASDINSDEKILIIENFPGDETIENVKKHFSTRYVYEVSHMLGRR
ncbi:hypothetical protein GCM10007199_07380 [Fictibacillus barbaricus]|nr:hypothetical protein GCM10007199_07380 [Fictibacillus barbaricus]